MRFKIFILGLLISIFTSANELNTVVNKIETQVYNVKLYSLKALNLSLKAYSYLNSNRKNTEEIKVYLKSALFFLNEANIYSPSYIINKKIDTILLRIELFESENFEKDILSLREDIDEIRGNIINYEKVVNLLDQLLKDYSPSKNKDMISILDELKKEIKLPLIDDPLENAKTFIAISYDNVKSRKYSTAKKSIEVAIDQLIKLTSRENLYLVAFKDYIYKSYLEFKKGNYEKAKIFLKLSKDYLLKSKELADTKNIDVIDGFLKRMDIIYNVSEDKDEILKEYLIIIQEIKNL